MLTEGVSFRPTSGQPLSLLPSAACAISAMGGVLNAYFTLRYAQTLWPDDVFVSTAVALLWEASFICFAAAGLEFLRQGFLLRGALLLGLAGAQMTGSAYASSYYIGQLDLGENEAAMAIARDHANAVSREDVLQAQIARTVGPKTLAKLRDQKNEATGSRQQADKDAAMLARGKALLSQQGGAASPDARRKQENERARNERRHRGIAVMLQLITVAAVVVARSGRRATPRLASASHESAMLGRSSHADEASYQRFVDSAAEVRAIGDEVGRRAAGAGVDIVRAVAGAGVACGPGVAGDRVADAFDVAESSVAGGPGLVGCTVAKGFGRVAGSPGVAGAGVAAAGGTEGLGRVAGRPGVVAGRVAGASSAAAQPMTPSRLRSPPRLATMSHGALALAAESNGPVATTGPILHVVKAALPVEAAPDAIPAGAHSDAALYSRVRAEVEAGLVEPGNRELQRRFGIGQRVAQRILGHMVAEGILRRVGRLYTLVG